MGEEKEVSRGKGRGFWGLKRRSNSDNKHCWPVWRTGKKQDGKKRGSGLDVKKKLNSRK